MQDCGDRKLFYFERIRRVSVLLIGLLIFSHGKDLYADSKRDQAKEAEYSKTLELKSPEAAKHFRIATEALDKKDYNIAVKEYRTVLELVQDYVPALRRLSYVVEDKEESLKLARKALNLENHPYNKTAVIRALMELDSETYRNEAVNLSTQLVREMPDDLDAQAIVCQAAINGNNITLLNTAVSNIQKIEPESIPAHYYAGIVAAITEKWETAEQEILRAKELGLPAEMADNLLENSGIRSQAKKWRFFRYGAYGTLTWVAGLVLLLLSGMILSGLTLKAVENDNQRMSETPSDSIRLIRRFYSTVLGLTSFYYYISLPLVILLVIVAGGGIIYGFFALGRIPIKLIAFVGLLMVVTLYSIIKSLFIRVKDEDPGPRLEEDEATELFAMLKEIANNIGTPMVDSVYIVPDATVAVYERGSLLKRFLGRTDRCLIVGLGVLKDMTQLQLKAILAHEFGHLNNRDTAGGSLALHVRRSIISSAQAMAEGGAAQWYNPAWLFITSFYKIFLRVSQGASRLQEVLADRWATVICGAQAFAEGLTHAVRRAIEFKLLSDIEISLALKEERNLNNLYSLEIPQVWPSLNTKNNETTEQQPEQPDKLPVEVIEEAFQEAIGRGATAYDSHPAPKQRIEWVNKLRDIEPVHDNGKPAWELFGNFTSLQESMTRYIGEMVQNSIKYA